MSTKISIPVIPLQPAPLWPPFRQGALFASDETIGSRTRPGRPHRILVIEDDLLIAMQIETTLAEAGFNVVGVMQTGEEALEFAAQDPPDLAIVDIRLAGDKDGVDTALEMFRSHGVQCIFASAYSDDEARQRAAPAAPLGWLQKPYSMVSLTEMVRTAADKVRGKGPR